MVSFSLFVPGTVPGAQDKFERMYPIHLPPPPLTSVFSAERFQHKLGGLLHFSFILILLCDQCAYSIKIHSFV